MDDRREDGTVLDMTFRTPELVAVADLGALMATRDAVCTAWRAGVMDPVLARERLRALGTRDAEGAWWRLRPGPHGAVLVRISSHGRVEIADPGSYRAPRGVSWWRRGAVVAAAALWVVVLTRYLSGAG